MNKPQTPLGRALSYPVLKQSMLVAVIVGTLLNFINQGDAILAGSAVNWAKIVMTYAIPLCVSTFGAWSMARSSPS